MTNETIPTSDDVFSAFKKGAVRKGYISVNRGSGRRMYPPRYHLTIDDKKDSKYQEYLEYRENFRHKGKKVSASCTLCK